MKKSFKGANPALQFITGQEDTQPTQDTELVYNTQPTQHTQPGRENKSSRLNLVLRPSLAQALKKLAAMRRISVNSLINDTLQALVDTEAGTIAKYNSTFEGKE
ncbi:MAG: hypothetical protein BWY65_01722 [Firmicutes bacterium ADurb.Bin373]|nr:MAG: hypothetical protein BWY65_01722 [Firmicutes bacterium ADurb.Bin373]